MSRECVMPAAARREATRKRSVNLSIRAELAEEAKTFGTNMSALLEAALEDKHRELRREKWRDDNRAAIEAWNAWIEENGVPFEELRPW
jgi:antitoxin CcdA